MPRNLKTTEAPRLYDYAGDLSKAWYIQFRMTCPETGERKPFQARFDINYYTTRAERYEQGKLGVKVIQQALKDGWNPFVEGIKEFLIKQADETDEQIESDK